MLENQLFNMQIRNNSFFIHNYWKINSTGAEVCKCKIHFKDSNKFNKNTGLEVIFIEFKDKSWSTTGFFMSMQLPALSELDVPLVCPHIVK